MIDVQLADPIQSAQIAALQDLVYLERAAQAALEASGAPPDSELTVRVTDDAQVRQLNRDFLGFDEPTDVLAFPSGESEPDPETGGYYLGDVVLSYPRAMAQAEAGGHPVQDELQLLVVHGVLHLNGFDHAREDEKARMWAIQAEILDRLGVSLRPPE
jgi:probable rRNA maturation factor